MKKFTLAYREILHAVLLSAVFFFFSKSTFLKKSCRNTIRVSNSLDPNQAQHFVRPDQGPNCLQKLSAEVPFVIKICVLSVFEWPFYTSYTVFPY